MNIKTLFLYTIILTLILITTGCDIPSVTDVELSQEEKLYVKEGEVCENQYLRRQCQTGLICKRVVSEPYIVGLCYQRNYTKEENETYIERYSSQIN